MKFLGLLLCFFYPALASAFIVGSFSPTIDETKETHVFVIGFAKILGTQFLESAVSTARRLGENFPERQYVFILQRETTEDLSDLARMTNFDLNIIESNDDPLLGEDVITRVRKFQKVASLEIISHGHGSFGAALSGNEPAQRFFQDTPGLDSLRGHFIKNAYVLFHGCNVGLVTAPAMSKILQIPVLAHLTSSNFEQPWSDGHWYFNDEGLYPKVGTFAKSNKISYINEKKCEKGNCSRLTGDDHAYHGDFGVYKAGLGFRKLFCNYDHSTECLGALATSLLGFPSEKAISLKSPLEDFMFVAKDLLCPSDPTREKRAACFAAIEGAEMGGKQEFSFFRGIEPFCDLNGCRVKSSCKVRVCEVEAVEEAKDNIMKEYFLYKESFSVLNSPK